MESEWREKRLYPALGIFSILSLIYLNFNPQITLPTFFYYWRQPIMSFVGVNHTRFVLLDDNSIPSSPAPAVYVNGWNSYWLLQESVWENSRFRVSEMMKRGAEMGLTVCRTWAFSDGRGPNSLQVSPGVFNEQVFQGLDYKIVEARRHRIRLILSLVNNLKAFGGKAQYVRWAQEAGVNISSSSDSFFSHPIIKDYYKNFLKAVITRKNSFSGVKYSEEPAIFAWELMNEPWCEANSSAPVLEAWITEMAAYVKSLDSKHLVTVGLEGFYGMKTFEKSAVNPGEWAASLGSDFLRNSATVNIDFASVHAYPHSWIPLTDLEGKIDYLSHWVDAHVRDGENVLEKPVLFTEVGSPLRMKQQGSYDRDIVLQTVYDKIYESAMKREAGSGALVWQLLIEGLEDYSDRFSFVAREHPSTYKLIVEQSCRLQNLSFEGVTKRKVQHSDPCFGKVP